MHTAGGLLSADSANSPPRPPPSHHITQTCSTDTSKHARAVLYIACTAVLQILVKLHHAMPFSLLYPLPPSPRFYFNNSNRSQFRPNATHHHHPQLLLLLLLYCWLFREHPPHLTTPVPPSLPSRRDHTALG